MNNTQPAKTMKTSELTWETDDGVTFGYYDLGDLGDIEIEISPLVKHSMWNTATNVRDWYVTDPSGNRIAEGKVEGLRAAKSAALAALASHLA